MRASAADRHREWLGLVDVSGPFLPPALLAGILPNGPEPLPDGLRARLREAVEARDAARGEEAIRLRREFALLVLEELLDLRPDILRPAAEHPEIALAPADSPVRLAPDFVLVPPPDAVLSLDAPEPPAAPRPPVLLVSIRPEADPERALPGDTPPWSPARRLEELCRATGIPLGLAADGLRFVLVHARPGGTASLAAWDSSLWPEEPILPEALRSLLGRRRLVGARPGEGLADLMERAAEAGQDVTARLGMQVREAAGELVTALDAAGGPLIRALPPGRVHDAAAVVMMRVIFLLCAEERGLIRTDDPRYDASYAVSTLHASLRAEADAGGEELLERRHGAWSRLLALFRIIHAGIGHPDMPMPPRGGSLFDPDAHPFLEGREEGTSWRDTPASPPPVSDAVILHALSAVQFLRDRRETGVDAAVRLSFRALDVEQLGHVYESLLDRTAVRAAETLLGIRGAADPDFLMPLAEAEALGPENLRDHPALRPAGRRRAASGPTSGPTSGQGGCRRAGSAPAGADADAPDPRADILRACGGDGALADRILPFHAHLRRDLLGRPLIIPAGRLHAAPDSRRRDTGAHYTPASLTRILTDAALEPHVLCGPAEGLPREKWTPRSAAEILSLRVCDMAMGSGAFLVQACRRLAEHLSRAWERESTPRIPRDAEERLALARRRVAETCLHGVDNSPMAVEMARLSLWLVTMDRRAPFTFLDHALRCGDALMGVTDTRQIARLSLRPGEDGRLFLGFADMEDAVRRATEARRHLEAIPTDSVLDVERKRALLHAAAEAVERLRPRADALLAASVRAGGRISDEDRTRLTDILLSSRLSQEEILAWIEEDRLRLIRGTAGGARDERTDDACPGWTRPLHWALDFPEIFGRERPGFDVIIGNPPFKGSFTMRKDLGAPYLAHLVAQLAGGERGLTDLAAFFFLRAAELVREGGDIALVATNTIAQGGTRETGLLRLERAGCAIRAAWPNTPWEGAAAVTTSQVIIRRPAPDAPWRGPILLNNEPVPAISSFLKPGKAGDEAWEARKLPENTGTAFIGSYVLGMGFLISDDEAAGWIGADPANANVLFPYLNGKDLVTSPETAPSRWVISFFDWDEARAQQYVQPFARLEERVRPEREMNKRKQRRENWWLFAERAVGLYHAVGRGDAFQKHPKNWKPVPPLERVLAMTRVSKYGALAFIPNTAIMDTDVCVFASDDPALFGLLQSSIHSAWAWKLCSTMGEATLRYTPTTAFETFPLPARDGWAGVRDAGRRLHERRAEIMRARGMGLTELYNAVHDPESALPEAGELRNLHEELDRAAAAAWGWDDLDMGHGFREQAHLPERDRIRHAVPEETRLEILRRLLRLNRERFEAEAAGGAGRQASGAGRRGGSASGSRGGRGRKGGTGSLV